MKNLLLDYDKCIDCNSCMKGCLLLDEFTSSPKELLKDFKGARSAANISFSCASCNYCESVCPEDISFKEHFYKAKKEYAKSDTILNSFGYKAILFHQKNSFSKLFTSKTKFTTGEFKNMAFMPGCALSSYSPKMVKKIYAHLKEELPGIGVIQQCCGLPTRVLGDMGRFDKLYSYLEADLANMGCDTVVTACENCYMSLKELSPHIKVKSLYEVLDSIELPASTCKGYEDSPKVALHDPCPTRYETVLHVSVRSLMDKLGLQYEEFKHNRKKTECCGSGGMLELTNPKLALKQINSRANQTDCDVIVSYCQSCSESMTKGGKYGVHILDLIYNDRMKDKMKQKKNGTAKKWFNRYVSKKMIEKL